jgi:hypothetical protein
LRKGWNEDAVAAGVTKESRPACHFLYGAIAREESAQKDIGPNVDE